MDIHSISFILYNTFLIPVTFFSFIYYIVALRGILSKEENAVFSMGEIKWPKVTIQIPTFNEPVAIRCAESCLNFDYPKDKYEIILGDDGTDAGVSKAIDDFARGNERVKVTRRGHNKGFKAGNLNHMLKFSEGEIIVIFDSDFTAPKNFLRRVVRPFMEDGNVGCVQAEWDFLNEKTNYISKLSSTLLMFYYSLIVPINNKLGVPFLFGSGEAVRKDVILKLGGWQEGSLTEDTEFSLRVFEEGHRIVYLNDVKVTGELPYTLVGLISQQRRWAYGNTRAFLDHSKSILFGRLSLLQKVMVTYTTSVGYLSNFFLLLFLVTGTLYFFSQPPAPIDIVKFISKTSEIILMTSGFLLGGVVALTKKNKSNILFPSLISVLTVGFLVSFSVCIGFFKAIFGKEMEWSAINKQGNFDFYSSRRV
ncbi:MAG: glycosyltransferase [Candidatus Altiarchaeota archaeon]|nr:glycosyltransferase [Candidatus Altiarchaeota archaeon]